MKGTRVKSPRLRYINLSIAVLLTTVAYASQASEPVVSDAPKDNQVDWLQENAVAFRTARAGSGFDDLEALRKIIGDARIVGLGESTHGTREHAQMKHRIVEFLASEMGFTILSVEASTPEAYRVGDDVIGGDGDGASLLGGLYFWMWSTEEILAMVEWMREFNESGGHIKFTGFDMQTPDVAAENVRRFLTRVDPDRAAEVWNYYERMMSQKPAKSSFAFATWGFPIEAARGKRVRFSGSVKTENVRDGWAGLWWRVNGEDNSILGRASTEDHGSTGTTLWTEHELEIEIPEEAANISFGVLLIGGGAAWFDDLTIELDGEVYDSEAFDFGFEGPRVLNATRMTNDHVYRTVVDDEQFVTGTQSLKLHKIQEENFDAVSVSREIVEQMASNRDHYAQRSSLEETEWAIHNATIINQCMRTRVGGESWRVRDVSMAENVEWIVDQNPDARIVLWAHNGHIGRIPKQMGEYLSQKYGADYLPIGFVVGRGEYSAWAEGELGIHRLQAPPPGSIESFFAKTNAPRLILDVRGANPDADDSHWLTETRMFRHIGAVATDTQFSPENMVRQFDVLVYFRDSAATRPLNAKARR